MWTALRIFGASQCRLGQRFRRGRDLAQPHHAQAHATMAMARRRVHPTQVSGYYTASLGYCVSDASNSSNTRPSGNVSSCQCLCGGPLIGFMHLVCSYSHSIRISFPVEHILISKGSQWLWILPSKVLSPPTSPFSSSFYVPSSPSPFDHRPPSPPVFFLFPMSDSKRQLCIHAIHHELNHAISNNLYTGLAYGTPPSLLHPFSLYVPRMPDHPSLSAFISPQSGYFCVYVLSFPIDPSRRERSNVPFFALSCSSKGPVFRCLEHMFLFGITTIIFILSTAVIVLGPAVIFQAIAITNKYIDPSFDGVWSQYKFGVVFLIILVITRLNARFPPSFIWSLIVE